MKNLKTFEQLNESELTSFKVALEDYCKEREEDSQIHQRALELLDEMEAKKNDKLSEWLTKGKTLLLQKLLRETTYKGNAGDNSKETLRDFNAFALLDTVSHNKNNKLL